ncbi:hypothetical protein F5Y15DRAFT_105931 [Xylariaceae sp. FL0016]|nr:hypothetical protein F5Y15DRAFT_105931 [Xylariaceae sp. FL0016]
MTRDSSRQKAPRQNLVKRACDACKVRKIKCSESLPCDRCVTSGLECTFNELPTKRGPRNLRPKTLQRISGSKSRSQDSSGEDDLPSAVLHEPPSRRPSSEGDTLLLIKTLEIYDQRLYPIWPIVDTRRLIRELRSKRPDHRAHVLARSIRLATCAQLRLDCPSLQGSEQTSPDLHDGGLDLTGLRIAFFLHIYHENIASGQGKSLLYLREALTIAQLLRLDREPSYLGIPEEDQQIRRRILWLLFVTERGVAMLHKLPVILRPGPLTPLPSGEDRSSILPAFLKLVNMFWALDQSGMFEMLLESDADLLFKPNAQGCIELLHERLQDGLIEIDSENDVQRADLLVTRQWMRAILWRAAVKIGIRTSLNPIQIAKESISFITQLPIAAIEAHGQTVECKMYDIADVVIDAISHDSSLASSEQSIDILRGLQKAICTFRGDNSKLATSLYLKITSMPLFQDPVLSSRRQVSEISNIRDQSNEHLLPASPSLVLPISAHQDFDALFLDFDSSRYLDCDSPNYHSLDQQSQQMSWPPLDLSTPLLRTPSPLTRLIVDQP